MAIVTWVPDDLLGTAGAAVAPTRNGSLSISDSYRFLNDGKVVLLAEKSGAGACTATVVTPATLRGLAVADPTYTVPATTGDVACGPFDPATCNDSSGYCSVTFSEITGLTAAVLRLP